MVSTKERIYKALVFAYLVLFPFGQILRTSLNIFGKNIRLHPVDVIVFLIFILWIFEKSKKPKLFTWLSAFALTLVFSLLFSLNFFEGQELAIGILYLIRVFAYISVFLISWDILKVSLNFKSQLFNSLLAVSFATAVFGWIQYFFYPDLRALAAYGWDDHYYRLTGTFLDPGFTSIILVFGLIILLSKHHFTHKKSLIALLAFFLATIAFTYSRAGYLATFAGLVGLLYLKGKLRIFLISLTFFVFFILILPRENGEGVNLQRTSSISARLINYSDTLRIFKQSPLFGVGFNNLCVYREKYLSFVATDAHSCSGADSSIIFLLATAGILGLIVVTGLLFQAINATASNVYGLAFLASIAAVGVHSFFHNSLFYPWVMGYLAILASLSQKGSKGKN